MGYRARSAFKLEQLDLQCDLLSSAHNIVDLCGAPGSWSQYIALRMKQLKRLGQSRIISIDLQEMAPIPGVRILQADITQQSTIDAIHTFFNDKKVDIVVSDGAPDVTGLHDIDEYVQAQLILAALNVALKVLKPNGSFVAKVFRQKDTDLLYSQLQLLFDSVSIVKPRSSRNSSIEAFAVCKSFNPVRGFNCTNVSTAFSIADLQNMNPVERVAVPFISAGDLSGLDADMSYSLDTDVGNLKLSDTDNDGILEEDTSDKSSSVDKKYQSLPPVISPIEPPYAESKRRQRNGFQNSSSES